MILGASSLVVLITEPCSFRTKLGVPESNPGWVPNDLVVDLFWQAQVFRQPQAKVEFCKLPELDMGADFVKVEVEGRVDVDDFKLEEVDGSEDEVEGPMFIVFTLLSSFSKDGTPDDRPEEVFNGAPGVIGATVGGKLVEVDKGTPVAGTTGAPKAVAGGTTRPGAIAVAVVDEVVAAAS